MTTTEFSAPTDTGQPVSSWFRVYDLSQERTHGVPRNPVAHQAHALGELRTWYESDARPAGGLLVFPTGAGKTFTAVRFLATGPLSDGYRVLWLAHTHHLLEQAADALGPLSPSPGIRREVGLISEPISRLNTRVVSGAPGHSRVADIAASDNVVFMTLQSASRAWNDRRTPLHEFLAAAHGKLCVVFDEAHHAPAVSYARFITELRTTYPDMSLLGLTATPTYSDDRRRGWLLKLFPQGKIAEADPVKLTAQGILAKPVYEQQRTHFEPRIDQRSLQRWLDSYGDVPEDIIDGLAANQERNDFIVQTYRDRSTDWGKTIIFTDRWFQCEYIRDKLLDAGVRAEAIYSHVAARAGTAEERNRRSSTDNADAIAAFKRGDLDVLINVRLLTEGTDIPDAETVFITRQTTSRILLTQMVGRALRGVKFGGTPSANIVLFIDDWKEKIAWAEIDDLFTGEAGELIPEYGKRPPLMLVSIDLIRRLVRDMESGGAAPIAPFVTYLPVGWYHVEFRAALIGPDGDVSDDAEDRRELVMVYEHEFAGFQKLVEWLQDEDLSSFELEDLQLDDRFPTVELWRQQFFGDDGAHLGGNLDRDLFHVARHIAQSGGDAPPFFAFEERSNHDLATVAELYIEQRLDPIQIGQSLRSEYERSDRYWRTLFPSFDQFHSQYSLEQQRIVAARMGLDAVVTPPTVTTPEHLREREPSEAEKAAVKRRDAMCLCCGELRRRRLVIDHIAPAWVGGSNELQNLQTLCTVCNGHKGITEINFTLTTARLKSPPEFELIDFSRLDDPADLDDCARHVLRTVDFFYRAQAAQVMDYRQRGRRFYEWRITLFPGNQAAWATPHMPALAEQIRMVRARIGKKGPDTIIVDDAH